MKRITGYFLATFLVFSGNSAFGAHPLISDDAGTLGRGNSQIEITGEYGSDDEAGVKSEATELAVALGHGLTDSVDLILAIPYLATWTEQAGVTTTAAGVSDLSVELKYRFYDQDALSLALKPGISVPTGDEQQGLGSGRATASLFFIASHEATPLTMHLNLGYIRNENLADEQRDLWHLSLASELELDDRLRGVANIGWERNPDSTSDTPVAFILGGFVYSINQTVDLDLGIKYGLSGPETDFSLLAGLTICF
ncbi:MAG: transporter [Desulfobacterales bacterium]|nr:transporter [Desulfobacterales bacterium]